MRKTLSRLLAFALLLGCVSYSFGGAGQAGADSAAADASAVTAGVYGGSLSYEAEASGNTFTGNASVADCGACSGGKKVGGLYQGASMTFTDVNVPAGGKYNVVFAYISGDPRSADISVNGGAAQHIDFEKTADWDTLGTKAIAFDFVQGTNTIEISDGGGYAPDFDKIDLYPVSQSVEAEAPGNLLTGNAAIADCSVCSGGKKVGGLYQGASLQFNNVQASDSGTYRMTVYYISGDPRSADISVNGGEAKHVDFAKTADWDTVGVYETTVSLNAGNGNTILFSDGGGYSPDIDRIVLAPAGQSYEAEAPDNVLTGNASVAGCAACSGGQKVGNVYQGASLQFNGINVPAAGSYDVTVYYISGDPRAADVSVNGGPAQNVLFAKTADWDTVGTQTITLTLQAGSNAIQISDGGGYAPDFDRIVVSAGSGSSAQPCEIADGSAVELGAKTAEKTVNGITVSQFAGGVIMKNGDYTVTYDTGTGFAEYAWNGKTVAKGIYGKFNDLATSCYSSHSFAMSDVQPVKDGFGSGVKVKFVNAQADSPSLIQWFSFYPGKPYFFTRLEAKAGAPISSNDMAPLVTNSTGGVDIGSYGDGRVLSVPYDNDMWIRHQAEPINSTDTSYEVSAVYDNTTRNGLIVGSVTHDTWKTGIHFAGDNNRLNNLEVYGGASSAKTHDSIPHGSISGTDLWSPLTFVGFYGDYRTGMEDYGKANAVIAPPLAFGKNVPQGVPVGWNSWAAYGDKLTYQDVLDTSDYIKAKLQPKGYDNKKVAYVNLDSYWDNLTDDQLAKAVARIKQNGQKAGIYWGPFVYWGDNMNQPVEGSTAYTYGDIILKDKDGNPLPKLDGAYAIDPTHPGAKERMAYYLNRFKKLGFEYIKLDFLTHGALEGQHYDPAVTTGTQAYNKGMAYIDSLIANSMFISESIAPLFPSQYAHSRRIATDTFGSISDTEFELNALTYGWWQNGTIYHYADPDHMALTRAGSLTEARSRVNSAVITGTVFLNSDDFHDPKAQQYAAALLTNPDVLEVAKKGKAFRAVEGNTGAKAADVFVKQDKSSYYIAVFNYGNAAADKTIDLARAGLSGTAQYKLKELWTGAASRVQGKLHVHLEPMESKLFELKLAE
ncbi:carbohydrate-binding protein [Paenibacillus humicola]|uniref:carbohydrate-binding protein n=1 Tax=Paenibacillus humicola TaxID=3110540 RepID=UPI00237A97F4|nr:carbohydrate-binding protein [Paenibacillus humicola]